MTNNIVDFKQRKAKVKAKKYDVMTQATVDQWVEDDIDKLAKNIGKTREEAIKMASDFYMSYPALIEHVRTPEFMAQR